MREQLHLLRNHIIQQFLAEKPIATLVKEYTQSIDELLQLLWQRFKLNNYPDLSLIACGGYGRGELQLHSDIDLLILSKHPLNDNEQHALEQFIQACWDSGLQLSQNVHTLEHCINLAKDDVTVMTSMMESRPLTENNELFQQLQLAIDTSALWPSREFFEAKCQEQQKRYSKYDHSAYNLQPNVKQGPGGLRDIHMITWIAKRHFGVKNLSDLVSRHILSSEEFKRLKTAEEFLWRIIFGLHILTGRSESRLLFDYQIKLAAQFGYKDKPQQLAIEQFMKDYFRVAKSLRALNDMFLQLFREVILENSEPLIVSLNDRFLMNNHCIEVKDATLFKNHPECLLEFFLLMAQHPEIKGTRANTIRLIHDHSYLIDHAFRNNKHHCQLFIDLLRQASDIALVLQRMNRYGVFSNYLPAFGQVVGQMQYDLFHAYTVDQHTLFVIRNICRFYQPEYRGQFPLCAEICETITKPELLYLAALFHDLAKGRGGDHSRLGAEDAEQFCLLHGIIEEDSKLVTWLVEHHLLMSLTAQREDIHDPNTIEIFANKLSSQRQLDHLYLLTVADINATNPTLWNSWKDSLLKELYERTKLLLQQQNKIIDVDQLIREKRVTAYELLDPEIINPTAINELWQHFPQTYYYQESPANIAWHTQHIIKQKQINEPLVLIKQHKQAATEIVIYCKSHLNLFAVSTAVLSNLNLNILEARINNLTNGFTLSCYMVHDENSEAIHSQDYLNEIRLNLIKSHLLINKAPPLRKKRLPQHFQHFPQKPNIAFQIDKTRQRTIMEITTLDKSGLLAEIGNVFIKLEIQLHHAKIMTMGERVEDRFFITDQIGQLIDEKDTLSQLREMVLQVLA